MTFGDQNTYAAYLASGGELDLGDWRRDNVNKLIQRMNTGIHEVKPWVKFSISPFGIFRAGHPEGMPPPIAGMVKCFAAFRHNNASRHFRLSCHKF